MDFDHKRCGMIAVINHKRAVGLALTFGPLAHANTVSSLPGDFTP
jgi:hypothetical protein